MLQLLCPVSKDGLFDSCSLVLQCWAARPLLSHNWSMAPPHSAQGLCTCLTTTAGLSLAGSARCDYSISLPLHALQHMADSPRLQCDLCHDLPCIACASWHTAQSCRSCAKRLIMSAQDYIAACSYSCCVDIRVQKMHGLGDNVANSCTSMAETI